MLKSRLQEAEAAFRSALVAIQEKECQEEHVAVDTLAALRDGPVQLHLEVHETAATDAYAHAEADVQRLQRINVERDALAVQVNELMLANRNLTQELRVFQEDHDQHDDDSAEEVSDQPWRARHAGMVRELNLARVEIAALREMVARSTGPPE